MNFTEKLNIYRFKKPHLFLQQYYLINKKILWKYCKLTTFEDMYETHEQRAQLLAVEGVLLFCNVHFNLSG